jgi:hypothetical protein
MGLRRWIGRATFVVSAAAAGINGSWAAAQTNTEDAVPQVSATSPPWEACSLVFGQDAIAKAPSEGDVSPGDPLSVDLTWGRGFRGSTVEVIGCTAVNGTFSEALSVRVPDVPNDGLLAHEFTVPRDIPDGAELCERALVIGWTSSGTPKAERLDAECFSVVGGAQAAATETGSTATARAVPGETKRRAPTAAPVPTPGPPALARTGAGGHLLAVTAGVLLILGGFAAGSGRPRRKQFALPTRPAHSPLA